MGARRVMRGFKRPPKYSCSICNKQFTRKKQHFNHVMRKSCGKNKNRTSKAQTEISIDRELLLMAPQQYHGRDYNFNPIPTGNRHLRTGIPLPRISTYRRAAI